MEEYVQTQLDNLHSDDPDLRFKAFLYVLNITEDAVDWAYEVWDDLIYQLEHKNPHHRAVAAQVLINLAKSDPNQKMLEDVYKIYKVTGDEKFVTARQTLQHIWKIALVSPQLQTVYLQKAEERFVKCISEKKCTLIRSDIIEGLKNLYVANANTLVKQKAFDLIALEACEKNQKKYRNAWREVLRRESKGLMP